MLSVIVADNGAWTKNTQVFTYFSKWLESGHHIYELIMLNNCCSWHLHVPYLLNFCLWIMMSDNVRPLISFI